MCFNTLLKQKIKEINFYGNKLYYTWDYYDFHLYVNQWKGKVMYQFFFDINEGRYIRFKKKLKKN